MMARFWRVFMLYEVKIFRRAARLLVELHQTWIGLMQDLDDVLEKGEVTITIIELIDESVQAPVERRLGSLFASMHLVFLFLELHLIQGLHLLVEEQLLAVKLPEIL